LLIDSNCTDGALLVPAMMFGGMRILTAKEPGFAFRRGNQFIGIAKRDAVLAGELFRSFGDEHHVRAFFKNGAGRANGIFHVAQAGDSPCAQRGRVHDDGVALDVSVKGEMRSVTRIEDGIVFENNDSSFDRLEGVAAIPENGPAGMKRAETPGFAGINGIVGDVPGATVNNERWLHGE
jgi:hypothetical protein